MRVAVGIGPLVIGIIIGVLICRANVLGMGGR